MTAPTMAAQPRPTSPTRPPEPFRGADGSVVVFSDVACPWATVVVHRLLDARARLGLEQEVTIIHLAHPLELLNDHLLARRVIDAEIPLCAALTPDFGWSLWQGRLDEYPVTSLLAAQAVQAARRQSEAAAVELDLELRRAFFVRSRCISVRNEVRGAAERCPQLDVAQLLDDLADGAVYEAVLRQAAAASAGAATCSGYLVLPDGTGVCNPGVQTRWVGAFPGGAPALEADDPTSYRRLLLRAAGVPVTPEPPLGPSGTPESTPACAVPIEENDRGNDCGC